MEPNHKNTQSQEPKIMAWEKSTQWCMRCSYDDSYAWPETIPDVHGLTSLKVFNISGNKLTGIIPDSIFTLSSLSYVGLGNNLLQGPTPGLTLFKNYRFDRRGVNSFCLDAPGDPCDPRVDALLYIVEDFGFPVVFAESWKRNDLCNSTNKWVGITCSGADITVIDFKGMGLNGTISPSFARLWTLKVINLSHNNLNGYIPEELTELRSLETIDVSDKYELSIQNLKAIGELAHVYYILLE